MTIITLPFTKATFQISETLEVDLCLRSMCRKHHKWRIQPTQKDTTQLLLALNELRLYQPRQNAQSNPLRICVGRKAEPNWTSALHILDGVEPRNIYLYSQKTPDAKLIEAAHRITTDTTPRGSNGPTTPWITLIATLIAAFCLLYLSWIVTSFPETSKTWESFIRFLGGMRQGIEIHTWAIGLAQLSLALGVVTAITFQAPANKPITRNSPNNTHEQIPTQTTHILTFSFAVHWVIAIAALTLLSLSLVPDETDLATATPHLTHGGWLNSIACFATAALSASFIWLQGLTPSGQYRFLQSAIDQRDNLRLRLNWLDAHRHSPRMPTYTLIIPVLSTPTLVAGLLMLDSTITGRLVIASACAFSLHLLINIYLLFAIRDDLLTPKELQTSGAWLPKKLNPLLYSLSMSSMSLFLGISWTEIIETHWAVGILVYIAAFATPLTIWAVCIPIAHHKGRIIFWNGKRNRASKELTRIELAKRNHYGNRPTSH